MLVWIFIFMSFSELREFMLPKYKLLIDEGEYRVKACTLKPDSQWPCKQNRVNSVEKVVKSRNNGAAFHTGGETYSISAPRWHIGGCIAEATHLSATAKQYLHLNWNTKSRLQKIEFLRKSIISWFFQNKVGVNTNSSVIWKGPIYIF